MNIEGAALQNNIKVTNHLTDYGLAFSLPLLPYMLQVASFQPFLLTTASLTSAVVSHNDGSEPSISNISRGNCFFGEAST